jgi:HD-like signal output (HDOD) protein
MTVNEGKRNEIKARIQEGMEELPSLSPAVQEILRLANDLQASPKDLIDIIRTDPVLTAKILRLVNSAYFSLNSKIASLNRALVLLGFNTIKNVAVSAELIKISESCPDNEYFDYQELWEHMLGVGAVAKVLAAESGEPRKILEEYFIAGLIHDLGDFLLMRFIPAEFSKIRNVALEKEISVRECSRSVLGFSSGEMGAELASNWKLQEHLQDVIKKMEELSSLETKLEKIISIADRFCRVHNVGFVSDMTMTEIRPEELEEHGIAPDFLDAEKERLLNEVDLAKDFIKDMKG